MNFYWSRKSIPELAGIERKEYRDLLALTRWKPFLHWQFWLFLLLWITVASYLLSFIEGGIHSMPEMLVILVSIIIFSHSVWLVRVNLQLPHIRLEIERRSKNKF